MQGAKDNFVWLVFQEEGKDPHDAAARTLYANSFDLIRMQNGKVQEHWDSAKKWPGSPILVPSTAPPASTWITTPPPPDEQRSLIWQPAYSKDV